MGPGFGSGIGFNLSPAVSGEVGCWATVHTAARHGRRAWLGLELGLGLG